MNNLNLLDGPRDWTDETILFWKSYELIVKDTGKYILDDDAIALLKAGEIDELVRRFRAIDKTGWSWIGSGDYRPSASPDRVSEFPFTNVDEQRNSISWLNRILENIDVNNGEVSSDELDLFMSLVENQLNPLSTFINPSYGRSGLSTQSWGTIDASGRFPTIEQLFENGDMIPLLTMEEGQSLWRIIRDQAANGYSTDTFWGSTAFYSKVAFIVFINH